MSYDIFKERRAMLKLFLSMLLIIAGPALAKTWSLDPTTRVSIDVTWRGSVVEVQFPGLAGAIEFDETKPDKARARIVVPATGATTGVGIVDALVRSPNYLAVENHPEIVFDLDRLAQTSPSTADIFGRITFRGVTRPLAFKAQVFRYGPSDDEPDRFEAGFDLTGSIDRTEFGSTGGLPEVPAVLPIRIRLLMVSG